MYIKQKILQFVFLTFSIVYVNSQIISNNQKAMLYHDEDGNVLPVVRVTLNLTAFEESMNGTLVGDLYDAIVSRWANLPEDLGN